MIRNYVFKCSRPTNVADYIAEQSRLYTRYYNKLIESARRYHADREQLRIRHSPEYASIAAEDAELQKKIDGHYDAIRARNQKFRQLTANDGDRYFIESFRALQRACQKSKWEAIAALRTNETYKKFERQLIDEKFARDKLIYNLFGDRSSEFAKFHVGEPLTRPELQSLAHGFGIIAKSRSKPPKPDNPWFASLAAAFNLMAEGRNLTGDMIDSINTLREFLRNGKQTPTAKDYGNLWWGTRLKIAESVERATEMADKQDEPPRFKRSDCMDGVLMATQIQDETDNAKLFSGDGQQIRCQVLSSKKDCKRVRVQVRIGSIGREPLFAEVVANIHRELPEGARVKWATLIRKDGPLIRTKVDGKLAIRPYENWTLQLSIDFPNNIPRAESGVAAVHLGSKVMDDGTIRVATWCGESPAGPINVPEHFRSSIVMTRYDDGKEYGELRIVPDVAGHSFATASGFCEDLQSIRDKQFDDLVAKIVELKKSNDRLPQWFIDATANVERWASRKRLVRVVTLMTQDYTLAGWESAIGETSTYIAAVTWLEREIHLGQSQDGTSKNARLQRRELYRVFAAMLRKRFNRVIVTETNLAKRNRKKSVASAEPEQGERSHLRTVSHGILRDCIKNANAGYDTIEPCPLTVCPKCQSVESPSREVMHTCIGCGETWDRLQVAAYNILASGCAPKKPRDPLAPGKKGKKKPRDEKGGRWATRKETRSQKELQLA